VADPHRTLTDRAQPLLEEAAERSRVSARARAERVKLAARSIAQVTLAAVIAWLIATELVGHAQPFFAPVSAIITLGLTLGQRGRRAVEVIVGVTLGIAVGDMLVLVLGTGAWQLAVVVGLAMTVALLLGSGQMFAQQAAVSAALVATLQPPTDGVTFARALDALIGGGTALLVNALVLPADPAKLVRRAALPVLRELAAVLDDLAAAVEVRDVEAVQAGLDRARAIDTLERDFEEALDVGRETAWLIPPRRRALGTVETYASAAVQIDLAVRNVRVLARGIRRAVDLEENVPEEIVGALRDLAQAVGALDDVLGEEDAARAAVVRARALSAAGKAAVVLERTSNMSVTVVVGQIRSTAVDILRGSGLSYEDAADAVRAAARDAEERAAAEDG
jgi:F0F1-type ATP synthase assembly protein I